MEQKVHDIATKIRQRKISITITDIEDVEGSFNLNTSRHNIMYTFFYSNISDFSGDLEGIIDEGTYKNIHTKYAETWLEGKLLQVC